MRKFLIIVGSFIIGSIVAATSYGAWFLWSFNNLPH